MLVRHHLSRGALALALIALPAVALCVSLLLLGQALGDATGQPPFGDWRNYRDAVARLWSGEPLYLPLQTAGPYFMPDAADGYSYLPSSALWLIPFGQPNVGIALWTAGCAGYFLTGLWAALYRDLRSRAVVPFAVALLGLALYLPFASGVLSGNVNMFLIGTYAWCWAVGRSEAGVGALAAVGALFKLFPSVLILWPTGRARRRSIGIAAVVGIGSSLVSLPLVGTQAWLDAPSVIINAQPYCVDVRISLTCALMPALGLGGAKAVAIGATLVVLAAAIAIRNDRAAFVLFGVAMMAPVSDLHFSYWLIPYVAGFVALAGILRRMGRREPAVDRDGAGSQRRASGTRAVDGSVS